MGVTIRLGNGPLMTLKIFRKLYSELEVILKEKVDPKIKERMVNVSLSPSRSRLEYHVRDYGVGKKGKLELIDQRSYTSRDSK